MFVAFRLHTKLCQSFFPLQIHGMLYVLMKHTFNMQNMPNVAGNVASALLQDLHTIALALWHIQLNCMKAVVMGC